MLKNITRQLLSGWHLARWIRLALGITLFIQAIVTSDMLVGAFGFILLGQAAINTGCCSTSGCCAPLIKQQTKDITGPTK